MSSQDSPYVQELGERSLLLIGWVYTDSKLVRWAECYGWPVVASKIEGYFIFLSAMARKHKKPSDLKDALQEWIDACRDIGQFFSPDDDFHESVPKEYAQVVFDHVRANMCEALPTINALNEKVFERPKPPAKKTTIW